MQRISITNPQNVIDGTAKKYYFKLRNTGGPKGDKGDKGDTGATGPQGPQGNAATVSVGSTTTLPVGYDATVTNSGSIYNAVLNFGIPQGPQGPQGAKGDKGDTGAQGETGPRGPQGERGTNATVYVGTTTTTNPGTQARVYNSGTDSNAVLNFEIPRGDVGPQPELVQTTGTSTTKAMSQNATTVALATKQNTIDSSHKLSADLVDDTSTTNKFVTASEKATWNAKQNALTAGDNIQITGDTISTPAIVPEVVASLPATGAEGKLYLTPKNYTRSTGTGNPITATVTDGAGQMESFQLDGDTFQQSYEGKNLVGGTLEYLKSINTAGTWSGDIYTVNGISWKPIFSNGLLDRVEATGKAISAGAGGFGIRRFTPTEFSNIFNSTDEYTLSGCPSGGSGSTYYARILASPPWTEVATDIGSGVSKVFNNIPSGANVVSVILVVDPPAGAVENLTFRPQIEKGSVATAYEPYVGGVPSPNPDYPQQIKTVTGEQTITIGSTTYPINLGKNLFDNTGWEQGQYSNGVWADGNTKRATSGFIPITGGTYTMSLNSTDNRTALINLNYFDSAKTWLGNRATLGLELFGYTDRVKTFTLPNNASYLRVTVRPYGGDDQGDNVVQYAPSENLQVEAGSQATTYAPYFEPIELCKLGTYQDYIYKDGESWKVHKATDKASFSTLDWAMQQTGSTTSYRIRTSSLASLIKTPADNNTPTVALCNYYLAKSAAQTYSREQGISVQTTGSAVLAGWVTIYDDTYNTSNSLDSWKTTDAYTSGLLYYPLATATDTTITNTTLIAQLEAIRTATLETGTNTITNTAAGSNFAGNMEIGYYGYNPTNRYDKWLWLDLNNNYEQIGE